MGSYTAKLARRIKEQGVGGSSPLILTEYMSSSVVQTERGLFSHNVYGSPQYDAAIEDTVLATQTGDSFYVTCKRV